MRRGPAGGEHGCGDALKKAGWERSLFAYQSFRTRYLEINRELIT